MNSYWGRDWHLDIESPLRERERREAREERDAEINYGVEIAEEPMGDTWTIAGYVIQSRGAGDGYDLETVWMHHEAAEMFRTRGDAVGRMKELRNQQFAEKQWRVLPVYFKNYDECAT